MAFPYQMSYMGRITDAGAAPVSGPVDLDVAFFHTATSGEPVDLRPLHFAGTPLKDGIFQISLNLSPAEFGAVFDGSDAPVYIQVTDATHARSYPRQLFSAVPYALRTPVDDKTLAYNSDGQLAVALPGPAPAGQFLTSDASGRWLWATPVSGTFSALSVQGSSSTLATNTAGTSLSFSGAGVNTLVSAGALGLGVSAAQSALEIKASNTKTSLSITGDKVAIGTTAAPASSLEIRGAGATSATSGLNVTNSSGASNFFIRDDGKVGIGTTAPSANLDVMGNIVAEGTAAPGTGPFFVNDFQQTTDAGADNQRIALIRLRHRGSNGTHTGVLRPLLVSENAGGGQFMTQIFEGGLRLGLYAGGENVAIVPPAANIELKGFGSTSATYSLKIQNSSAANILAVRDDGKVGIGTSSPGYPLQIGATEDWGSGSGAFIESPSAGGQTPVLQLAAPRTGGARGGNGDEPQIVFWSNISNDSSGDPFRLGAIGVAAENAADNTRDGAIVFRPADNEALTERMRIMSSGNVGIGLSGPIYKLDVAGDINTTTCVRIAGTSQLGSCPSDERFKKNIVPITGALAKLSLLRPVHYEFRTDEFPERHFSHSVEAGLIAQDLEQVFPDLVLTDGDGYKRVNYGLELEMQTVAAVRELKNEKDLLSDKVARLEDENKALRAKMQAISAYICGQAVRPEFCADSPVRK